MKVHHGCPVQATINVLSGKWKVQAVWRPSFGPLRFAELRNLLRGVSEKVLTAQLRELEKDGVVNRRAVRSSPPKVTYSLQRLRPDLDSAPRRPLRLGLQAIWHHPKFAPQSAWDVEASGMQNEHLKVRTAERPRARVSDVWQIKKLGDGRKGVGVRPEKESRDRRGCVATNRGGRKARGIKL